MEIAKARSFGMHMTRPSRTSRLDAIAVTPLLASFQLPQKLGKSFGDWLLDEPRIEYLQSRYDLVLDCAIGRSIGKIGRESIDMLLIPPLRTMLRLPSWRQLRRSQALGCLVNIVASRKVPALSRRGSGGLRC